MDTKFITKEKMKSFQESLGWLDTITNDDTLILVGESLKDYDSTQTALLAELRSMNTRKVEIIKILMK
jgi:hypothetical protein